MDVKRIEKKIGITFENISLLKQALTHRSYANENRAQGFQHNERLEFLGDAVLELCVTDYLFKQFPNKQEGELTAFRSALVNTQTLSQISDALSVNKFLLLSKGESRDTGRARQFILANTFEALVGAIYLDRGYDTAYDFIARNLFPLLEKIIEERLWQDSKSYLQEIAQDKLAITPTYKLLEEKGPDHGKIFTMGVYLGSDLIAKGEGESKRDAEQAAARKALKKKGWGL